jgi:hypothetical protein
MKIHTRFVLSKHAIVKLMLALLLPAPVFAFQIKNETGEVIGSFDTTVSLGSSWRAQKRDPVLVGISNGGSARSNNEDDGNLNFNKHKNYSNLLKVTHELGLKHQNYGLFTRGTYFYDFAYSDQPVSAVAGYGARGRDRVGSNGELLDLFVYGSFDLGGRKLNARLGQQVVSWGEGTFIPNGINVINPVDLARLRAPGSELKEAFVPQPMVWASHQLTDRLSVEAFYQIKHRRLVLDPRGTYFSTNDFISDDGDRAFVGFGRRVDQHAAPGFFTLGGAAWAPRSPDRDPGDSGQYGLGLRSIFPELNNTELGFFFMNYHSRTPFISATRGAATIAGAPGAATCGVGSTLININTLFGFNPLGQAPCVATAVPLVASNYFVEYPESIRLFGVSFNTAGPAGIALQGEYSYRPNQPVQLASTELLLAALGLPNNITGMGSAPAAVAPGTVIAGYRRTKMHQFQISATKAFGPTWGAEQFALLGEVGYTYLDLPSSLLFNGPAVHLPAPGSFTGASNGSSQPGGAGYATTGSWGYRVLGRLDYSNAIAGGTLSPRIAYSHDVHGVSPTFNQGTRALTFGLTYNLKQNWVADLAYTTYWGGRTYGGTDPVATAGQPSSFASSANPLKDRDFISLSVSYSF